MIYYVRHGETPLNFLSMMCGCADVELTENGKIQASETGKRLKNIRFDAVYCSPMIRARQTAAEILKHITAAPIFYDERLRERKAGDLEGLQDEFYPFVKNRWDKNFDCALYNYESTASLFSRVRSFIFDIENMKGKNVLIVAHSGIGRAFKAFFNGENENGDLSAYGMQNGKITVFPF